MPDNILSKLFFQDTNGWNNVFPNGGVPLYNSDIRALENTSKMYGAWTFLKDYDCIVSGCLVDEVNTDTKQVTITAGYFVIGGIMYHTEGFTTTYPFSLIPGSQTTDDRIFKNGDTFAVATTYNYSIKTSGFDTYDRPGDPSPNPDAGLKPANLSNEIFFDPFTNQRLEYIQNYTLRSLGESILNSSLQSRTGRIIFTQTGKTVTGSEILFEFNGGFYNFGRWKYYGWQKQVYNSVLRINSGNAGSFSGNANDEVILNKSNLPRHKHAGGTLKIGGGSSGTPAYLITEIITSNKTVQSGAGTIVTSINGWQQSTNTLNGGSPTAGLSEDGVIDGIPSSTAPFNISPYCQNFTLYRNVRGGTTFTNTDYYIKNNINPNHYNF